MSYCRFSSDDFQCEEDDTLEEMFDRVLWLRSLGYRVSDEVIDYIHRRIYEEVPKDIEFKYEEASFIDFDYMPQFLVPHPWATGG